MIKTIYTILLIILLISLSIFTNVFQELGIFMISFYENVISYLPLEIRFLFSFLGLILAYGFYLLFKS